MSSGAGTQTALEGLDMPRDGSGTKAQIVAVAMRRFVEEGYDRTSLREIADEVGVTKAALYYHFRTKEDIVRGAMSGYAEQVAELAAWAADEPAGRSRDEQLVDRLVALVGADGGMVIRFGQTNPTVLAHSEFGGVQLELLRTLVQAVAGDEPEPEAQLRATLVFAALIVGSIGDSPASIGGDQETRFAAARTVALDLLAPLSS